MDLDKIVDDISSLLRETSGLDYTSQKPHILSMFEDYLLLGIWDISSQFDAGFNDIYIVEENEFDGYANDSEGTDWGDEKYIGVVSGYVILGDLGQP